MLLMNKTIKINHYKEQTSWHIPYKKLAQLLARFANHYKENSSKKLFELCMNDAEFRKLNKWSVNYLKWENYGLDPIHIFASFNYSGITKDLRIRKLRLYFRLLGSELEYDDIIFIGIPSPNITRIMSARNLESQNEIWKFFCQAMKDGYKGINGMYDKVDNWYGVQIPALTIFLFWIDSDTFFPLDKNTVRLLRENDNDIPYSTQEYVDIIKYNIEDDGIFRELVKVAYE